MTIQIEQASAAMESYFLKLQQDLDHACTIAHQARAMGFDPEKKIDIKLAKNMAERVEGLISVVAPQLIGSGVTHRIIELEKEYTPLDWRVALRIAVEVAEQKFCTFKDKKEAIEVGIRTGFAYQTGGIVSAPLEGLIEVKIKKRADGKEYFAPCYAGPIRGAGGTAAAFSLLITDYVRVQLGYATYDPTEKEIGRYKSEIYDYHERVTNLQYLPSPEEIEFLMRHLPVEIDGDPTEQIDVSNYKDIERIGTNKIRGGMCLVLAEGLSQKSPKLWKRLEKWGKDFSLSWDFLSAFLTLQKEIKAKKKAKPTDSSSSSTPENIPRVTPNYTFIADLVAGRPVLTQPMASGGFRLRYGRTRMSGFSAAAIHPATMVLLDDFIAIGTQLKVERPGKAAAITPCSALDASTVLLQNGSVQYVNDVNLARKIRKDVKEILYMGDILFNFGDFSENGHILVPPGYCEEWWVQELELAIVNKHGSRDISAAATALGVDIAFLNELFASHGIGSLDFSLIKKMIEQYNIPLHPSFTYYWSQLSLIQLQLLLSWLQQAKILRAEQSSNLEKIVFPYVLQDLSSLNAKRALELLGIEHLVVNQEFVVIEKKHAEAFLSSLGIINYDDVAPVIERVRSFSGSAFTAVQELSLFPLRDKAGTFIGCRMGRPEKAKMRKLTGSPHVLFPVGDEGGRLRSFQEAHTKGVITADFPSYFCPSCKQETLYNICEHCFTATTQQFFCSSCGKISTATCSIHGPAKSYHTFAFPFKKFYEDILKQAGHYIAPALIKGVRGTSNKDHIPEHFMKGVLRAKHDVYVNKDGTIRFDMSEVPLTHFKPCEAGVSVARLHELGYLLDIYQQPLITDDQILELKVQDLIIPSGESAMDDQADKVLVQAAHFIDDLLMILYKQESFYRLQSSKDLIGHLVVALAPHISAGMIGRIIGFSKTQAMLAHPLFHASLRRDCDGDEASISLLLDALLNFSSQYLPNTRGAKTMDAPLVLTSKLIPSEVDDQALGIDVVWQYPLSFYEAALQYKNPWEAPVEQLNKRIGTPLQYEGMGYTHPVESINDGVACSSYKSLPSMQEKLKGQMQLAIKIRAVDPTLVATMIINKHFLKDTKGNLRKFSQQSVRCVQCNESHRRPPLLGKCTVCGGKLLFTVSEGSIVKYLGPSISLANEYQVSPYLIQTLEILKRRVEGVFGKDKEKQEGLGKWFG